MNVYISYIPNYLVMRGPAPDGFHVPSRNEWVALCGILTSTFSMASNATTVGTYLKMPKAGGRSSSSSNVLDAGSVGYYWSSTPYTANSAYRLWFDLSSLSPNSGYSRTYGISVRCFKNTPVIPDSNWTTLYQGTGSAGVFRNSSLGLISVSGDGTTWYTIQDKNLGATTVYNQGDTLTDANCGYFYQWGNNYGFAHSGTVTTSATKVDASGYGPGNYYNSSTFITGSADWSSVQNDNLWGYEDSNKPSELYKAYIGENPTWKPNEHTVAYRPLTETTTQYDQSGNNYNLTKTDGSFTTLGDVSCFYNGGGSTGYFTLNSAPKIPSRDADRTISLWARPSGYHSSYSRPFLSYGQGSSSGQVLQIGTNTSGAYRAYVYGATLTANQTFTANTRSLITFVAGGGSIYLYVDGVQQATSVFTLSTVKISTAYPLRLMRLNTSTSSNYQVRGYLSEVIIEDKAWTATEIANYFNDNKEKYGLS